MTERWTIRTAVGTALGLALLPILALAAGGKAEGLSGEAAERFLRTAAVVGVEKDAQAGRTLPWLVTLEKNGLRAKAVFKYVHRPRPHPLAHSYRYELAAYELSKILGLVIVPPTVERTVEGVRGALQLYAEGCISEHDLARSGLKPPDPRDLRDRLDTIRLFEALSGDACGDADDTLIHTDTWKVCRVDFAEAFRLDPELSEDCSVDRCPKSLYQRMLQMEPAATKRKLRSWLTRAEVEALCGRKGRIITLLDEKIRTRGEAAVLFAPEP
jgi:hypothetical protein